jgi:transposase InsO family protein
VASFSFCASLVSDEEALNWLDQREKSIRSVQQAGAKDKHRVKQAPSANEENFYSLKETQVVIEKWRVDYNTKRPHSALGEQIHLHSP